MLIQNARKRKRLIMTLAIPNVKEDVTLFRAGVPDFWWFKTTNTSKKTDIPCEYQVQYLGRVNEKIIKKYMGKTPHNYKTVKDYISSVKEFFKVKNEEEIALLVQ